MASAFMMREVPPVDLVIFDCDGVLVDSEGISSRVLAEALTAAGLPTSQEHARDTYQGLLLGEVVSKAEANLGHRLSEEWVSDFEDARANAFANELRAVAGAEEAVVRVKAAGVGVCVASQGKVEKTRMTLGLCGLLALFAPDALFSAQMVARSKPCPDLFLHAAAATGVAPERCVVVDDSPSGVLAAMRAGMRAVSYVDTGDPASLRAVGAQTLRSLEDLPRLIGSNDHW